MAAALFSAAVAVQVIPATARPVGLADVTGVLANDDLNVRTCPGTGNRIVGALTNATTVRNLGSLQLGQTRWCQIELLTDMCERGWVHALCLSLGVAVQLPSPPLAGPVATLPVRVRFVSGTSSAELAGVLQPGESRRYLLGARDGQFLSVRPGANGPGLFYRFFNPDRSFLLDEIGSARDCRGQLWQSGDHVVEVINRGNRAQSYQVVFSIQ